MNFVVKHLKFATSLFFSVLTVTTIVEAAFAADYYKQACEHYRKGEFGQAARLFSHIAKHVPEHTAAHYQLANCYLNLGRVQEAKAEYQATKKLTDDLDLLRKCDYAIMQINKGAVRSTAAATPSASKAPSKKVSQSRYEEELQKHTELVASLQAKKDQILKEAREKTEKIRKDARDFLEQERLTIGQWSVNKETGERYQELPQIRIDYVMGCAEVEVEKVLNDAQARVHGIRMPPSPSQR